MAPNNNILNLQEQLDIISHACMDQVAHQTSARTLIFQFDLQCRGQDHIQKFDLGTDSKALGSSCLQL